MTFFSRKQFLLLFSLILSNIFLLAVTQPINTCFNNGNYTSNSTYRENLNTLLSSIPYNVEQYGFYSNYTGTNSDRVYAIALCRGDIQPDTCRNCINETANLLVSELCPGYKEAVAYPDKCTLRYSTKDMTGVMTDNPVVAAAFNVRDVQSGDQFNQVLRSLMESLRDKASSGGYFRKFAVGDASGPDNLTIYGLVQCTPDLSESECMDCLQGIIGAIGWCCSKKDGAKIVQPNCNLRYEVYTFYNETAVIVDTPPPDTVSKQIPPPPPDTGFVEAGKKSNSIRTVLISVGAALIVLVAFIFLLLFLWRTKHKKQNQEVETMDEITTIKTLRYDFKTIRNAT